MASYDDSTPSLSSTTAAKSVWSLASSIVRGDSSTRSPSPSGRGEASKRTQSPAGNASKRSHSPSPANSKCVGAGVQDVGLLHTGLLSKKSTKNRHLWQKRFFVLRDIGLLYYNDKAVFDAGGLSGARSIIRRSEILHVEVAKSGKGSEQGRRLNLSLKDHDRVFELMADTREACEEWVSQIKQTIITEDVDSISSRQSQAEQTGFVSLNPSVPLESDTQNQEPLNPRKIYSAQTRTNFDDEPTRPLLIRSSSQNSLLEPAHGQVGARPTSGLLTLLRSNSGTKTGSSQVTQVYEGQEEQDSMDEATASVPMPQNVVCSGMLSKKSSLTRHMWQRRYFVLCTQVGLIYYKDKAGFNSQHSQGWVPLESIEQVTVANIGRGSEDGRRFNLAMNDHSKVLELVAEDRAGRDMWVAHMASVVDGQLQASNPDSSGGVRTTLELAVPKAKFFLWNVVEGIRLCAQETAATRDAVSAKDIWHEERTYAFAGNMTLVSHAPSVFQDIRHHIGISTAEYLASWSFAPDDLPSLETGAGRSGSLFMSSKDKRYILKSIPMAEVTSLKAILKDFYMYFKKNRESRISPVLALLRFGNPAGFGFFYAIVVINMLWRPMGYRMDQKFDLKGRVPKKAEGKRPKTPAKGLVWKDNQIKRVFHCTDEDCAALIKQIEADCGFLRDHNLMDYSLLVGVEYRDGVNFTRANNFQTINNPLLDMDLSSNTSTKFNSQKSVLNNTTTSASAKADECQSNVDVVCEYLYPHGPRTIKGHEEFYYISIIDYLSPYGHKKKAAHFFKSFLWKPETLSTVPASYYHDRFIDYMPHIFTHCDCGENKNNLHSNKESRDKFREKVSQRMLSAERARKLSSRKNKFLEDDGGLDDDSQSTSEDEEDEDDDDVPPPPADLPLELLAELDLDPRSRVDSSI